MTKVGINPKEKMGALKPDLSLVPLTAMIAIANGLADGAVKYGYMNWRSTNIKHRPMIAAAMRHLGAYMDGEDYAEDSGVHHLHHVMAGVAVLIDAIEAGSAVDDRPPAGGGPNMLKGSTKVKGK